MSAPARKTSTIGIRLACVQLMQQLLGSSGSMTRLLPEAQSRVAEREQAQLQAWAYGFARYSGELEGIVDQLLDKPLKKKDLDVYLLMQLGVFQLRHTPTSAHAAVDETVKVVKQLKKPWARGLINAVLRNYQRRAEELEAALTDVQRLSHPQWLLSRLQNDWPEQWQDICEQNNTQGPMTLRVNLRRGTVEDYRQRLSSAGIESQSVEGAPAALRLDSPVPVAQLPGFEAGDVSVQDAAAQLAAGYLARYCPEGGRLLDACSAPGGKTAHALESGAFADMVALDQDASRLERVEATLSRLGLGDNCQLQAVDAADIEQWWDKVPFDAVLLDAPCSGTGVIRRHPDIKLLRRDSDIDTLAALQASLLDSLWQTLRPGGLMLYATCSILKRENEQQIAAFLERTADAEALAEGRQILPGESGMDGFFYAPLRKQGG